jgi:hypothetical protein
MKSREKIRVEVVKDLANSDMYLKINGVVIPGVLALTTGVTLDDLTTEMTLVLTYDELVIEYV